MSGKRVPMEARFWSKVDQRGSDECWPWMACCGSDGYGRIGAGGRGKGFVRAHRVAWELSNGSIPDRQWVLHHCDNPPCCNPRHLFLGNLDDNMADMARKNRSGVAKLTVDDVRWAREWYAAGWYQEDIARALGVSQVCISQITRGVARKHV